MRHSADSNYRPRAIITEATELKNFVWFVLQVRVLPAVVGCGFARFDQLEVNALIQICRKIYGLGCVTRALVHA